MVVEVDPTSLSGSRREVIEEEIRHPTDVFFSPRVVRLVRRGTCGGYSEFLGCSPGRVGVRSQTVDKNETAVVSAV